MNGDDVGRTAEDTGDVTLSAAEVKALASGNPLIMEQVKLTDELSKLDSLKKAYNADIIRAKTKYNEDKAKIAAVSQSITEAKSDIKSRKDTYSDNTFSISIGNQTFTDKKDAGISLLAEITSKAVPERYTTVGKFAGFEIRVTKNNAEYNGLIVGEHNYKFNIYTGNTTHMINQLCNIVKGIDDAINEWSERLEEFKTDLKAQEDIIAKPFAQEEELNQKRTRFNEIMAILNPPEEQNMGDTDEDSKEQKQSRDYLKEKLSNHMTTSEIRAMISESLNVSEGDAKYAAAGINSLRNWFNGKGKTLDANRRYSTLRNNTRTVALGITTEFVEKGYVNFRGTKLSSDSKVAAEQLATKAMILRDPRFETFRVFYTKGNEIVHQEAFTSKMVDSSPIGNESNYFDSINRMKDVMSMVGADGYYLLHNHPSGNPKPSQSDMNVSYVIAQEVNGFRGHIVIDHNKFSYIYDYNGGLYGYEQKIANKTSKSYLKRVIDSPYLYKNINNCNDVANIGINLAHDKSYSVIVYCDTKGITRAIQEAKNQFVTSKDFGNYVANRKSEIGAFSAFVVTYDNNIFKSNGIKDLYKNNFLRDVVYIDNNNTSISSFNDIGIPQNDNMYNGKPITDKDRIRVYNSEDISYQQRTNTLTDREVLEMAANTINTSDLTPGEKQALDIFTERLGNLQDLQTKRTEQGKLYKEQQFGANADRKAAKETLNRMHTLDSQIKKASADLLSVEEKEVLKRVLKKSRSIIENNEKQNSKEMLDRWRKRRKESDAITKYRSRIKTDVDELSKWILHPDNKNSLKRVPDVIKNSIIQILTSVDFTSKRQLNGGEATKADIAFVNNLNALRKAIKSDIETNGMYSGYTDLPPNFIDNLQNFIDKTQAIANNAGGSYVINKMTAEELRDLSKLIHTLKNWIMQVNKFHANAMFKHVDEAGNSSMQELRGMWSSDSYS